MGKKLAYVQALAAGQLGSWIRQCRVGQDASPQRTAGPLSLAALAQYASALVLSDGLILTNGPDDCRDIVPDWAFTGWTQAYDAIEEILSSLDYGLTDVWPCADQTLRQLYEALADLPCVTVGDHLGHIQDPYLEIQNFLAWEFLLRLPRPVRRDGTITTDLNVTDVVRSVGGLMARVLVETRRFPATNRIEDEPIRQVLDAVAEIQFPLILPALMSRIDRKGQFLTELETMRSEFARVRQHIADIERLLSAAARGEDTTRELRLLLQAYQQELRKTAGEAVSPPAPIELASGLWLTAGAGATRCSEERHQSAVEFFAHWELRMLARWPRECARGAVVKLRDLFATHGTDESWHVSAQMLQAAGAIAWYPLRSADHNL